jgi:hypothetical protein
MRPAYTIARLAAPHSDDSRAEPLERRVRQVLCNSLKVDGEILDLTSTATTPRYAAPAM